MDNIVLRRGDFTKLLGAIKLIENSCTDCQIVGGFLRQKTNDRHSIVVMDLNTILEQGELTLSGIKQKIQLLRTFELDDNVTVEDENIIIRVTDDSYQFVDPLSKMEFRKTLDQFLDNTFMPVEDFNRVIKCDEENLLFSVSVNAYMRKRIKNICDGFRNETIKCNISGTSADLSISTTNFEQTSKVVDNIELNQDLGECNFSIPYFSFAIENNAEITFNVYQVTRDVLMCRFEQKYFGIPVTIYSQAKLVS